jgi:class 3 adenylate cyclase
LVLYGSLVRALRSVDFPWGAAQTRAEVEPLVEKIIEGWGEASTARMWSPAASEVELELIARYQRMAISPKGFRDTFMAAVDIDIRPVVPTVTVPTLVLHKSADPVNNIGQGRYLADRIPHARLVELDGSSHLIADDDVDRLLGEIVEFLTGTAPVEHRERVLATVLFTDLVASTEIAVARGDQHWLDLLDDHDRLVRDVVARFRGRVVKTTGDGVLATFDGPARAVRAGDAIVTSVRRLGVEARAGVHTGEVELREGDVGGVAVHIGARIAALAQPGQVLVSRTVVDLVIGSQLTFTDPDEHVLRGVPGSWTLFALVGTSPHS